MSQADRVLARSRLSVVIPTWNGLTHLPDCLAALATQTRPPDEVIVVDNGSRDGTVGLLQERFPAVRVIANRRNEGFAQATNQGIVAAQGDLIVTLNNDTVPAPDCLALLCAPIEADPRVGAGAATLVFAHRPERVNSAGLVVGHDLVALDAALGEPVSALPANPWPVFGVSAGAAIFRRVALDDIGLFDGRFFAYLEDVDLAWRLRLRGWRALAVPGARVAHVYSATAGGDSAFKRYYLARNRVWMLFKNVPKELWRQHAAAVLWYDMGVLLVALARRDSAWLRGRRDGLRALPDWRTERRAIQQRRLIDPDELAAALSARVGPFGAWRARLQALRYSRRQ